MKFVYFTKTLPALDALQWVTWCQSVGLDGLDLAVRPGYPVNPDNVRKILPKWISVLRRENLFIQIVTAPVDLIHSEDPRAVDIFEACKSAGIPAVKIGYFNFQGQYEANYRKARSALEGFARLAERTGVKACYHTHSGRNLGNNGAGLRLLLEGIDPHYIGAFLDTGHLALGGGPFDLEVGIIKPWFSLLAIKDISWSNTEGVWSNKIVPVNNGIVKWNDVGSTLKAHSFQGVVSLHGEYALDGSHARSKMAAIELVFLKTLIT